MKPNPWERNFKDGNRAHKIAMEKLKDWQLKMRIDDYSQNMEKQNEGLDAGVVWEKATFDTKVRDYDSRKYGDVLIEIVSVIETQKPGWYYTSKADYIAYVWWNPKKTDLYEGYLISLQSPKLREWFERNQQQFEVKIGRAHV